MASPTQIPVSQLLQRIGTPDCPVLIDVCIEEDFNEDPRLIPTARRHPAIKILELAPELKGKKVIIICQKGLKLSAGAAALLRTQGAKAENLEGGNFGWRDAGAPLIPYETIPSRHTTGDTLWVTRHRPKIDRIACPWLIRRFIDPKARFLFVAPGDVEAVADKFDATPFDIPDVFWGHRGQKCTFDVMLEAFQLNTAPLMRLAEIIRGADTNRHDLSPEVPGLLAVCLGLSRMYRDDCEQLDAGMIVFDALYRWARDATDEIHSSPRPKTDV